jgi:hypothetical protein
MKITLAEEKTSQKTGKAYKVFTLEDGRKPSVFPGHTMWTAKEGDDIPDELIVQNGEYWNITDPNKKPSAGRGDFAKAQQFKTESIERAQKNKEDAIKLSSTFRDATLLTVAMLEKETEKLTSDQVKHGWLHWRSWLLQQYDNDSHDNAPPF